MDAWSKGLGKLFRAIGPVRTDGRVTTIGIRIDLGVVTTSWYDGPDELPPVVELPERACMNYESGLERSRLGDDFVHDEMAVVDHERLSG